MAFTDTDLQKMKIAYEDDHALAVFKKAETSLYLQKTKRRLSKNFYNKTLIRIFVQYIA